MSSKAQGFAPIPADIESKAKVLLDSAYKVHSALGPGLLESVYEACLAHEIRNRGLHVETQVELPVIYDQIQIEAGLRLDLVVEGAIIVELKAVDTMHPIYQAQLLTYLKLSKLRLGYLINFNVEHLQQGIKRMII
jgi:GxxExxY protein